MTQDIKKAAAPLGVVLHDHVITARNRHTSLRDLGLIAYFPDKFHGSACTRSWPACLLACANVETFGKWP